MTYVHVQIILSQYVNPSLPLLASNLIAKFHIIFSGSRPLPVFSTAPFMTNPNCVVNHGASSQFAISHLLKLTLPTFCEDPLAWQTFWDSFNAAVHANPSLSGVHKFNYLKIQWQCDAAGTIAGLPLTELNYQHWIALLVEWFGQPHKLVSAHMQTLLDTYA